MFARFDFRDFDFLYGCFCHRSYLDDGGRMASIKRKIIAQHPPHPGSSKSVVGKGDQPYPYFAIPEFPILLELVHHRGLPEVDVENAELEQATRSPSSGLARQG
jgi:hypothetical protein